MNDEDQKLLEQLKELQKALEEERSKYIKNPSPATKGMGGLEPIPDYKEMCHALGHLPPTHMVIPHGMQYRHICSNCGYEVVLRGPEYWCENDYEAKWTLTTSPSLDPKTGI